MDLWFGILWQYPLENCVLGTQKGFSSSLFWALHFRLQLYELIWESCLGSCCCWLNRLGGSPIWTLGLFLGLFMRHGAYFVRPSPTNLLKRRWFYLLNYLFLGMFVKINPCACAWASLVGQDLWLAPAPPPNRPWQGFIWSASSSTPGAGALASVVGLGLWLAPALPPHTPWQEFIWYVSSLTPGVGA